MGSEPTDGAQLVGHALTLSRGAGARFPKILKCQSYDWPRNLTAMTSLAKRPVVHSNDRTVLAEPVAAS